MPPTSTQPPTESHSPRAAIAAAWSDFGDGRAVVELHEVSAHVSTNSVFRVGLDDGTSIIAKVSSYGSYFLFREDHDRLHRCSRLLAGTRFEGLLAGVLTRDGAPYTWYDGTIWVVFYEEVDRVGSLPRILTPSQVRCFGEEMAQFHAACASIARQVPPTSTSVKSDAISLLDELDSGFAALMLDVDQATVDTFRSETHALLMALDAIGYDDVDRLPVLVDWNLGNFSVAERNDGTFRLATRWDYDWFRIDTRVLDFYFLSRVSSATGDRTVFAYSPHTLVEPRFVEFLRAYHRVLPLDPAEVQLIPQMYRFFILNYVVREGARFFRSDLCTRFRRDAAAIYLPALAHLDLSPITSALGTR